jgi:hypothetical protein
MKIAKYLAGGLYCANTGKTAVYPPIVATYPTSVTSSKWYFVIAGRK